jgi:thioredoxin 1
MQVYDFYAPWCIPCKRILPSVERFSTEENIPLLKINVEDNRKKFDQFGVKTVPTLILVNEREEEIKRVINPKNIEEIRKGFSLKS